LIEKGGKRPSAIDLHKLWVKEVKSIHQWTYEVSKCSPQQAFRNLDEAFKRVFKVEENRIKLPKFGWLKCSEILPNAEIKNAVVSRHSEHWFVSFKVEHLPQIIITRRKRK